MKSLAVLRSYLCWRWCRVYDMWW